MTGSSFTECEVEQAALAWLEGLGWSVKLEGLASLLERLGRLR